MSAFLVVTWTCVGLLAAGPEAQAAGERLGTPVSEAHPVNLVAPPHSHPVDKTQPNTPRVAAECDPLGTPARCFTPPASPASGRYLNVASFFDRRQLSLSTHFFLKYFDNAGGTAVEITGLGMHASSNSLTSLTAAGVLVTSRTDPALPLPADLTELQAVGIPIEALGTETCVEFDAPVRVEADQAAWLVVRFPPAPIGTFIGLLVDDDATDEDCDYMTPDAGEMYFRPDPRNGPAFDWAISAYTRPAGTRKSELPWTTVKLLYRDTDDETAQ